MVDLSEQEKEAAGKSVAGLIEDGMVIGLGTGTTIAHAINHLGDRIKTEGISILGIPTSRQSMLLAIKNNIPMTTLLEHNVVDIALDGADQVDEDLNLIKGGGGAQTREKIVALSSKRFVVAVDSSKLAQRLYLPVPLEVIPFGCALTLMEVKKIGGIPRLRRSDSYRLFVTDNGNLVIDADFGVISEVNELELKLSKLTGVVEHGIFTSVSEVHIGKVDEVGVTVEILKH
ncbi:MAG TPA: ribose 5-phosphate isomerase A [Candidatus Acidoferrales bacterium]|nr:ribose 5-phosphate isomerase A [Candidatus Acidoferrales bacterium]